MLSENLNNLVSELSSLMQTCDMQAIGKKAFQVASCNRIDTQSSQDIEIERILEKMTCEPLDDKLSLLPLLFAAQNTIQGRKLEIQNLERYHSKEREKHHENNI